MRADKLAEVKAEPDEIDYQDIGWEDWEPDPYNYIGKIKEKEAQSPKEEHWHKVFRLFFGVLP